MQEFGELWETGNSRVVCGSILLSKEQRQRGIRDDAAREKQEGMQGQWQQGSPFKIILKRARRNEDVGCSSEVLQKGFFAIRDSRWERFQKQ